MTPRRRIAVVVHKTVTREIELGVFSDSVLHRYVVVPPWQGHDAIFYPVLGDDSCHRSEVPPQSRQTS